MNYVCFIMNVEEVEPDLFRYSLIERVLNATDNAYEYYNSELLCQTQLDESVLEYKTTFDWGAETPDDPQDCIWMIKADAPVDIAHNGMAVLGKYNYGVIAAYPEDEPEIWYLGESEREPGVVWADTHRENLTNIRGFISVHLDGYPGTPGERKQTIRGMIKDKLSEDKKRFIYDEDSELLFFKE